MTSASSAEVERSTALAAAACSRVTADRPLHRVARRDQLTCSRQLVRVDLATQQLAQLGGLGDRVDHREGVDAFEDVVARRLAERPRRSR